MKAVPLSATYAIEVGPGECLRLPDEVARQFEAGTWILSIHAKDDYYANEPLRDHSPFLASYNADDEGLYDDDAGPG